MNGWRAYGDVAEVHPGIVFVAYRPLLQRVNPRDGSPSKPAVLLPDATLVVDDFHLVTLANDAQVGADPCGPTRGQLATVKVL